MDNKFVDLNKAAQTSDREKFCNREWQFLCAVHTIAVLLLHVMVFLSLESLIFHFSSNKSFKDVSSSILLSFASATGNWQFFVMQSAEAISMFQLVGHERARTGIKQCRSHKNPICSLKALIDSTLRCLERSSSVNYASALLLLFMSSQSQKHSESVQWSAQKFAYEFDCHTNNSNHGL